MNHEILATFETRRAAEMAVEHLVQEYGIARTDIVAGAEGASNSSGTVRSGADAAPDAAGSDSQPKLKGAIEVRVKCDEAQRDAVKAAFQQAGATLAD